jgi:serine/threonine protein kinase
MIDSERINTIFAGKYRIVRALGEGGMGTVYQAQHLRTDGFVALKILREDARDEHAATRMLREARALAKLDHPHIVRLLDADVIDGELCLVQEFVQGETLRQRLDAQLVCTPQETLEILVPIIDALRAAHRQNIVHRDIKPDNIILSTKDGKLWPKLVDFGIAVDRSELRHTRQGTVVGTPHYMSPEQAWGKVEIDARTDVWSIGMVAYECLAGCLAYDGANDRSVMAQIVAEEPTHLSHAAMSIDESLADIVMRCLVKKPEARIASMSELLASLFSLSASETAAWYRDLHRRFAGDRELLEGQHSSIASSPIESSSPTTTGLTSTPRHQQAALPAATIARTYSLKILTALAVLLGTAAVGRAFKSQNVSLESAPAILAGDADASTTEPTRTFVALSATHAPVAIVDAHVSQRVTDVNTSRTHPAHVNNDVRVRAPLSVTAVDSGIRSIVRVPSTSTIRGTNGAPIVEDL